MYISTQFSRLPSRFGGGIPQKKLTENPPSNAVRDPHTHARRTKKLNLTLITSHVVVVALIVSIITIGYRAPVEASGAQNNSTVLDQPVASVDQIAAADVATQVAQATDLAVQTNVSSLAISLNTKTELAQTDSAFLSKPQIVSQTGRKGITQYTTKNGDTVQAVARQFGISEDTVRWANNLTSDALQAGKNLTILGTTGVLYTVKAGDDAAKLADKYHADKDRIITFNDAELTGLNAGQQIVIPDGVLPDSERPGYRSSASLRSSYSGGGSTATGGYVTTYNGNGYAYGYCTWYAYNRRAELGRPIGSNWGNAVTWSAYARAAGFRVDRTPEAGAVLQTAGGWSGYGHVGIVEAVNSDGSILVSDMNYVGWNVISKRTIPASQVSSYNYIH